MKRAAAGGSREGNRRKRNAVKKQREVTDTRAS